MGGPVDGPRSAARPQTTAQPVRRRGQRPPPTEAIAPKEGGAAGTTHTAAIERRGKRPAGEEPTCPRGGNRPRVPTVAVASLLERDDFSAGGLGLGEYCKQPCEGKASDIAGQNA